MKCANADDEIAIRHADHQRCRIGLRPGLRAHRAPSFLARALVERDDRGFIEAVAIEDQQIAIQNRRSATAMLRFVHLPRFPDDFSGRGHGRRTLSAEVNVDAIAFNDGCG